MQLEPCTLPTQGRIARIAVTTTAATTNLADAAQLSTLVNSGQTFAIVASAACWVKLAYASGTEVSGAATTGDGRGFLLPANTIMEFMFKQGGPNATTTGLNTFLSLQTVTGTAEVAVAYLGRVRG